jgi:hypothetical protein
MRELGLHLHVLTWTQILVRDDDGSLQPGPFALGRDIGHQSPARTILDIGQGRSTEALRITSEVSGVLQPWSHGRSYRVHVAFAGWTWTMCLVGEADIRVHTLLTRVDVSGFRFSAPCPDQRTRVKSRGFRQRQPHRDLQNTEQPDKSDRVDRHGPGSGTKRGRCGAHVVHVGRLCDCLHVADNGEVVTKRCHKHTECEQRDHLSRASK